MGLPGDFDRLKDKEKVAVLQQRIQFQNETIENQKTQINEAKAINAELRGQLEKISDSIQTQTGIIAEQQRTLKDQESTILEQQKTISELQKQLISIQKSLETVTSQLTGIEGKSREKTEEFTSEIKTLKRQLDKQQADFNQKISEREDLIKSLREENANLETGVKELSQLKLTISDGGAGSLEKRVLELEEALKSADNTISNLEKEHAQQKQTLESELQLRDVKVTEYERLIKKQGIAAPKFTSFVSDQDTAAVTLTTIFTRTKSNVIIFLPEIRVLNDLDFENLRSAIRVQIAVPVHKDMQLIEKLKIKPNLEIRNYDGDIWGIIRDNEEMLLAPIGENNEPSGLILKGDSQIEAFGTVIRSIWARLKRV